MNLSTSILLALGLVATPSFAQHANDNSMLNRPVALSDSNYVASQEGIAWAY